MTAISVLPAYAGMIPAIIATILGLASAPRIRGDDPFMVI